jgi:hypothetical protein
MLIVPLEAEWMLIGYDERFISDPPKGRGRSIDGDLNIDKEGSEQIDQNVVITKSRLCWLSTHVHTSLPH